MLFGFLILFLVAIATLLYTLIRPSKQLAVSASSPEPRTPDVPPTPAAPMPDLVKKVKALVLMTSMYEYPSSASALYRILRQRGETGRFDTPAIQSILNRLYRDGSIARRRPHTGTNRQRRNATQYLLSAS